MKYCILSSLLCISWWVGAQLPGYGNHGWKEHISTMASMEDELYGNARASTDIFRIYQPKAGFSQS